MTTANVGVQVRLQDRVVLGSPGRSRQGGTRSDRGSASLWVVAGGALVLLVALVAVARGSAVLARERAEAASDLAALAAADGIGIDASTVAMCQRAAAIAVANDARLDRCAVEISADGRSGTVELTVTVPVRLAGIGRTRVRATSRAGRLAWTGAAVKRPP